MRGPLLVLKSFSMTCLSHTLEGHYWVLLLGTPREERTYKGQVRVTKGPTPCQPLCCLLNSWSVWTSKPEGGFYPPYFRKRRWVLLPFGQLGRPKGDFAKLGLSKAKVRDSSICRRIKFSSIKGGGGRVEKEAEEKEEEEEESRRGRGTGWGDSLFLLWKVHSFGQRAFCPARS